MRTYAVMLERVARVSVPRELADFFLTCATDYATKELLS